MDREAFANASLVATAAAAETVPSAPGRRSAFECGAEEPILGRPRLRRGGRRHGDRPIERRAALFGLIGVLIAWEQSRSMHSPKQAACACGRISPTPAKKRACRRFIVVSTIKEREVPAWTTLPSLAPGKRRLVSFESTDNNVSRVTVLIR